MNSLNRKRKEFSYQVGNKVLVKNLHRNTKFDDYFIGPFEISVVRTNRRGILKSNGSEYEKINNVRPFFGKNQYVLITSQGDQS